MVPTSLRSWAASLLVASSGLACAHGQSASASHDPAAVRGTIEGTLAQFGGALMRGDAAAIASTFTEDAVYVSPATKEFITGRAAIEQFFAARFKAARFVEVAIATALVQVEGDRAYEIGTNRTTVQAGNAPPVTRTGRYLTVWKRQHDGVWRIDADAIVPDPAQ